MPLIFKNQEGKLESRQTFVAWCGCGGVQDQINKRLRAAGVMPEKIPNSKTTGNRLLQEFLTQEGFSDVEPSLREKKHAVLINPIAGTVVNLLKFRVGAEQELTIKGIKEVYNG